MYRMTKYPTFQHSYKQGAFLLFTNPLWLTPPRRYTAGILFISPLGDILRRRPLVLLLGFLSFVLTIATAFTYDFLLFEILSVLTGIVTCVSQVLAPLTADLAPPERRASALAILIAGVMLGMLYARLLAGLVAQFSSWRVVYYVASVLQAANVLVLYFIMPDYPVKNEGVGYWAILVSLVKYAVGEPQLIQASLVSMVSMACFTNFWVSGITWYFPNRAHSYGAGHLDIPSRRAAVQLFHVSLRRSPKTAF